MKSGTWLPSPVMRQAVSTGRTLLFPDSSSCTAGQEQHTRLTHSVRHLGSACSRLGRCSISKESTRGAWLPHGPPRPAPSPWAGGVLGAGAVQGMERFSREVFQPQHSPPPQASLQLSLKTEKFVLVLLLLLLLLLSSYEMSPTTESLNKFWLLKQHLIQLLSNLHHNFKPLIY